MKGMDENRFEPNTKVNRAMLTMILYNMEGMPTYTAENSFKDVKASDWFAKSVAWAKANHLVSGFTEESFKPNQKMTREQLVKVLYEYAKFKDYDVTDLASLNGYKDQTSSWAREAMSWAVAKGLIKGKGNGTLDSKGECTRAEVAEVLMKFTENVMN